MKRRTFVQTFSVALGVGALVPLFPSAIKGKSALETLTETYFPNRWVPMSGGVKSLEGGDRIKIIQTFFEVRPSGSRGKDVTKLTIADFEIKRVLSYDPNMRYHAALGGEDCVLT